ncbi:hypothetical protein A9Q76_07760 [Arcobacter sp. 31_11_sub10_T18]|nr:hypothetical protein A9Q76_07760 [Arcobacter sp. 31_11_sub10_T18]
MIKDIIENENYKLLVSKQIKETMQYLIQSDEEFAVTANIKGITFNPELPDSIYSQLSAFSLFILANYTYSTLELDDNYIYFEAGFGKENFGSLVKIPYNAIFQIIVDESILFVNSTATVKNFFSKKEQDKKSFNAFKNNPNNENLI